MFRFLKIGAPLKGEVVLCAEVKDRVFAEEMLGKGIAIKPSEGKVYAPFDGEVGTVFETKHAISLISKTGIEVLIHVGIDTVKLNGEHYKAHVVSGQKIKKRELLLDFDIEKIENAGYDLITPVIVCNTEDYKEIIRKTGKQVMPGDTVMELKKK